MLACSVWMHALSASVSLSFILMFAYIVSMSAYIVLIFAYIVSMFAYIRLMFERTVLMFARFVLELACPLRPSPDPFDRRAGTHGSPLTSKVSSRGCDNGERMATGH
jgi:hypothetical protein